MTLTKWGDIDDNKVLYSTYFEALVQALDQNKYVYDGCSVSETSPVSMDVDVSSGEVFYDGTIYSPSSDTLTISAAESDKDRVDVIVYQAGNGFSVKTGIRWATIDGTDYPLTERIDSDEIPLAYIVVGSGSSSISNDDIYDVRFEKGNNMRSLDIGGTEVIDSSRNLKNLNSKPDPNAHASSHDSGGADELSELPLAAKRELLRNNVFYWEDFFIKPYGWNLIDDPYDTGDTGADWSMANLPRGEIRVNTLDGSNALLLLNMRSRLDRADHDLVYETRFRSNTADETCGFVLWGDTDNYIRLGNHGSYGNMQLVCVKDGLNMYGDTGVERDDSYHVFRLVYDPSTPKVEAFIDGSKVAEEDSVTYIPDGVELEVGYYVSGNDVTVFIDWLMISGER